MSKIFDSHCHFTVSLASLLHQAPASNRDKVHFISVSTCVKDLATPFLPQQHELLQQGVGLHPWFVNEHSQNELALFESYINANHVPLLGEIGLDFWQAYKQTKVFQMEVLSYFLDLADQFCKPVSIHCRKAYPELIALLKQYPKVQGAVHGFSGNLQQAEQIIQLGYKIGVGKNLLNPNAVKSTQLVRHIGLSNVLLESDGFYQDFESYLANIQLLKQVGVRISHILDCPISKVFEQTYLNTQEAFLL